MSGANTRIGEVFTVCGFAHQSISGKSRHLFTADLSFGTQDTSQQVIKVGRIEGFIAKLAKGMLA